MRSHRQIWLGLWSLAAFSGCEQRQLQAPARPIASPAAEFRPTASIVELMGNFIDPAADALWSSYWWESNPKGITFTRPQTDADWDAVRKQAVLLIEGGNLLLVEGRVVARPGERRESPPADTDLTPEQSLEAINSQRAAFNAFAHALQETGFQTLQAISHRNYDELDKSLAAIDEACEACHTVFWYPAAAALLKKQ